MSHDLGSESPEQTRALSLTEKLQFALTTSDLTGAADVLELIRSELDAWITRDAREYLHAALKQDLLLFNVDEARRYLRNWERSLSGDPDPDLDELRAKVEARARERQADLQIRGVTAHCSELWQKAAELEHSANPPEPAHILENYYEKAERITAAALADHANSAKLNALHKQAERVVQDKRSALRIYPLALQESRYLDALDRLDALAVVVLVPRFSFEKDELGDEGLSYVGMVKIDSAREEIIGKGRNWANGRIQKAMATATAQLDAYEPDAALETVLEQRDLLRLLSDDVISEVVGLEERAHEAISLRDDAQQLAREAMAAAKEDAQLAWVRYEQAVQTYAGAPDLDAARAAIVSLLCEQMRKVIVNAEEAYHVRRMDRVRTLYDGALSTFGGKDEALNELLVHLSEIRDQAAAYQDYVRQAQQQISQIRELLDTDIMAAAEELDGLDQLPQMVLEDLSEVPALRLEVRERLSEEFAYLHLYTLLDSDNADEVAVGIETARSHPQETRFGQLAEWLTLHRRYLQALDAHEQGKDDDALQLLAQIVDTSSHPDHEAAQALRAQLAG